MRISSHWVPLLLCLLLGVLPRLLAKCILVTLMGQHACEKYDVEGALEAVSACAYPHYCHVGIRELEHLRRQQQQRKQKQLPPTQHNQGRECIKLCDQLYPHQCAELGCGDRRRLALSKKNNAAPPHDSKTHLPLETWEHLHHMGLRHVHPSMCNSSNIIKEFAEASGQESLKKCIDMEVAIFTNGTFH